MYCVAFAVAFKSCFSAYKSFVMCPAAVLSSAAAWFLTLVSFWWEGCNFGEIYQFSFMEFILCPKILLPIPRVMKILFSSIRFIVLSFTFRCCGPCWKHCALCESINIQKVSPWSWVACVFLLKSQWPYACTSPLLDSLLSTD